MNAVVLGATGAVGGCLVQSLLQSTLMTAVGASSASRFRYLRYKAEIEDKVRALGFSRASFFRPSMLVTPSNRYGLVQAFMLELFPLIDPLLAGPLAPFRSIAVEDLGRAMALNSGRPGQGAEIHLWREFQAILAGN